MGTDGVGGPARTFHGLGVSPGVAVGPAFVYRPIDLSVPRTSVRLDALEDELARLDRTIGLVREQLATLEAATASKVGADEAEVFAAHRLMLDDNEFGGAIRDLVADELVSADFATCEVTGRLAAVFQALDDDYFREREADVRDVGRRLLRALLGAHEVELGDLPGPVVLVARDLAPSDTAQMDASCIAGIVTEIGGPTSHMAIMAKGLEIAAVSGVEGLLDAVESGEPVGIDAADGRVTVRPGPTEVHRLEQAARRWRSELAELAALRDLPAVTPDGHRVHLMANIGTPSGLAGAERHGAEGVGLFRTEFLFMDTDTMPGEEAQYAAYRRVVEAVAPRPVIIRTLDVGGDKQLPYLPQTDELNPFLGQRALRLCLEEQALFRAQIRAVLRAGAHGHALLMLPMVSGVGELRAARTIIADCQAELARQGIAHDAELPVGIMVEVPSAALTADVLATEADFFSIGTNDLCQYTLAADRTNEKVAHLQDPLHPAMLRLIRMVIQASTTHGRFTGMCGEMAADETSAVVLLGLGLDEFSMSAAAVPRVKRVIRNLPFSEAQRIAGLAMACETGEEVRRTVCNELCRLDLGTLIDPPTGKECRPCGANV